jgi:hypothetical protein
MANSTKKSLKPISEIPRPPINCTWYKIFKKNISLVYEIFQSSNETRFKSLDFYKPVKPIRLNKRINGELRLSQWRSVRYRTFSSREESRGCQGWPVKESARCFKFILKIIRLLNLTPRAETSRTTNITSGVICNISFFVSVFAL